MESKEGGGGGIHTEVIGSRWASQICTLPLTAREATCCCRSRYFTSRTLPFCGIFPRDFFCPSHRACRNQIEYLQHLALLHVISR